MKQEGEKPSADLAVNPLDGSLWFELRKASGAVSAAMARECAAWQLKPSEAALLRYIGANPGTTQSALARAFRAKPANLVPLVAALERTGLVDRLRGPGRAIALTLSVRGKCVLTGISASADRIEGAVARSLGPERHAQLLAALAAVPGAVFACLDGHEGKRHDG